MGVCQRLLPLATVGDGNCLLHAASLGMWGYHDRLLTLRKALHQTLTSHLAKGAIKRRWRLEQWQKNIKAGGLLYSEEEWEIEWQEVLRIASTQRRDGQQMMAGNSKGGENTSTLSSLAEKDTETTSSTSAREKPGSTGTEPDQDTDSGGKTDSTTEQVQTQSESTDREAEETEEDEGGGAFESLEDIHVFVLAHVLRRPVIIIADQFLYGLGGEAIAPIPFGGVYLPLEYDPSNCYKSPLVLAFDSAHFSPLVPSHENSEGKSNCLKAAVPLVTPNYDLLPLQFAVDPGEDFLWSSLDSDSGIADKLALSMDKKLNLLKKYLDMECLKLPSSKKDSSEDSKPSSKSAEVSGDVGNKVEKKSPSKSVEKKEKSWIATQIMKVGTMAGVVGSVVHSNVYVAKLQTDKKPEYYDKMIENYIQSAKARFEEEKKAQVNAMTEGSSSGEKPQPCITSGCQLYGTSMTNYLCSGCFKTQKSYSETGRYLDSAGSANGGVPSSNYDNSGVQSYLPPPSYSPYLPYSYFGQNCNTQRQYNSSVESSNTVGMSQPSRVSLSPGSAQSREDSGRGLPSYSEVVQHGRTTPADPKSSDTGTTNPTQGQSMSGQAVSKCVSSGCQFFGCPGNKGYCSACYRSYQKSLKYVIEENEASKSKVV